MALVTRQRTKKGNIESFYQFTVSGLSEEQHEWINKKAKESERSLSNWWRIVINNMMRQEEKKS